MNAVELNRRSRFGPRTLYRSALAIAAPIMQQQLIRSLVSLVDHFTVSRPGDESTW